MRRKAMLGALALVAVVAILLASGRKWNAAAGNAVLVCPTHLDLGERELGEQVVARFPIANKGTESLSISNIQTTCACAGIEREENGATVRVSQLRIEPGESVPVSIRLMARGEPEGAARYRVQFDTNDPMARTFPLELFIPRIRSGVLATPATIDFGKVLAGEVVRSSIKVTDAARVKRRILNFRTSQPGIRVTEAAPSVLDRNDEQLVALLDVEVSASGVGPFRGWIELSIGDAGQLPLRIPVSGHVAGEVEFAPPIIALPRLTNGQRTPYAECQCRAFRDEPFKLKVAPAPPGILVEIDDPRTPTKCKFVRLSIEDPTVIQVGERAVSFAVEFGGREAEVSLPLPLRRSK